MGTLKRDEFEWGFISTISAEDGIQPYETGIEHSNYRDAVIVVESYPTGEAALFGHNKWVQILTNNPPDEITEIHNSAFIAALEKRAGITPPSRIFRRKPKLGEKLRTAREVGEAILACHQEPMDKKQTEFMIALSLSEMQDNLSIDWETEKKLPFASKVAEAHARTRNVPVSNQVLLFLAALANSPGIAVMYVAALKVISERYDNKKVSLREFCESFPIGFPVNKDLAKIWEAQKLSAEEMVAYKERYNTSTVMDNLLDHADRWT